MLNIFEKQEIMENIEILINEKKIGFSFFYKFKIKGKYIIKYIIKKLTNSPICSMNVHL